MFDYTGEEEIDKVLEEVHPDLVRGLDIREIIPHLRQKHLINRKEYAILLDNTLSQEDKINKLILWIPDKGPNAMTKFIQCLKDTRSGTGHFGLSVKVQKAVELVKENSKLSLFGKYNYNKCIWRKNIPIFAL